MFVTVSQIREDRDFVLEETLEQDAVDEMISSYEEHRARSPLDVRLTFSRLIRGILARGTITGTVATPCTRCLEYVAYPIAIDVVVTFVPDERPLRGPDDDDELELTPDDLDVLGYTDDVIDIHELVRESVLLELTPFPTCTEDRPEDCEHARRVLAELAAAAAEGDDGEGERPIDPRWAALAALKKT